MKPALLAFLCLFACVARNADKPAQKPTANPTASGIAELLKMADAGVSADVMKSLRPC